MPRSSSPSSDDKTDYALELHNLLAALSQSAERESVASEIEGTCSSYWIVLSTKIQFHLVLQSIYGDDAIRLWRPSVSNGKKSPNRNDGTIRYEVVLK